MTILIAIIAAGIIMGMLDFVWLKYLSKDLYQKEIGSLLREKPSMVPALIFYFIYVIGVVTFIVIPAVDSSSWIEALLRGAMLGVVAYATYDLTNLATLKNFSKTIVYIDIAWGAFITAVTAVGAYAAVQILG